MWVVGGFVFEWMLINGIGEVVSVFEVVNIFRGRKRGFLDIDLVVGIVELRVVFGVREWVIYFKGRVFWFGVFILVL